MGEVLAAWVPRASILKCVPVSMKGLSYSETIPSITGIVYLVAVIFVCKYCSSLLITSVSQFIALRKIADASSDG
jgi:hypothetical protein